ncbi:MAG: hypothetical protein ABSF98_09065 [Bryobacteraceae bacterium]
MSVARQMVVMAGLLSVPMVTAVDRKLPPPARDPGPHADDRLLKLEKFFADGNCPLRNASADFLEAADRYALDWRLLPSISIVESSGGKVFRNNNVLGWGSCNRRFRSVRAGIHLVASRLATSTLYRDKGLDDVLATYNPDPEYVSRVKSVMRRLSSAATRSETRLN